MALFIIPAAFNSEENTGKLLFKKQINVWQSFVTQVWDPYFYSNLNANGIIYRNDNCSTLACLSIRVTNSLQFRVRSVSIQFAQGTNALIWKEQLAFLPYNIFVCVTYARRLTKRAANVLAQSDLGLRYPHIPLNTFRLTRFPGRGSKRICLLESCLCNLTSKTTVN